jgi:hypothetical protein
VQASPELLATSEPLDAHQPLDHRHLLLPHNKPLLDRYGVSFGFGFGVGIGPFGLRLYSVSFGIWFLVLVFVSFLVLVRNLLLVALFLLLTCSARCQYAWWCLHGGFPFCDGPLCHREHAAQVQAIADPERTQDFVWTRWVRLGWKFLFLLFAPFQSFVFLVFSSAFSLLLTPRWGIVVAACLSVVVALVGNIVYDWTVLKYFSMYFSATMFIIFVMVMRIKLLKFLDFFLRKAEFLHRFLPFLRREMLEIKVN